MNAFDRSALLPINIILPAELSHPYNHTLKAETVQVLAHRLFTGTAANPTALLLPNKRNYAPSSEIPGWNETGCGNEQVSTPKLKAGNFPKVTLNDKPLMEAAPQ